VPVILHSIHGWGFHRYRIGIVRTFFIFLENLTARITDRLIAVSEADINTGLKYGIGRREKYRLIRYGIDRQEFEDVLSNPNDIREEFDIAKDAPLVGMIACFKPQKDHRTFLNACARIIEAVPAAKFLLVGDGVLRAQIEVLIVRLGLQDKVILAGWRRDIARIMASLDVLVLSSLYEGLPIVILEAMASGRPVVATDVCGIREIVKDGENGYFVPPGDPEALADKIISLLKNKGLRERMGKRGRNLSEEFEESFMLQKINKLYLDLQNGH